MEGKKSGENGQSRETMLNRLKEMLKNSPYHPVADELGLAGEGGRQARATRKGTTVKKKNMTGP